MTYQLIRGDATSIPLADDSVDLVVTSPPYFALRSYQDGGEHYDGQIGSDDTPQAFLEALWAVTAECRRVLKPSGSMFINLGDKYAGSGPNSNRATQPLDGGRGVLPELMASQSDVPCPSFGGIPNKSLMMLPHRYAIGCIDQLDLILRADIIWSKPNGLPESVTDRVRRSHEDWFHFTKAPRYYTAVDEIREPHTHAANGAVFGGKKSVDSDAIVGASERRTGNNTYDALNPLGKLPGSVWTVPTEPLRLPPHLPQHFAAFPSEWPRRLILGWSPPGICVECGQGRRPVYDREIVATRGRATQTERDLAAPADVAGAQRRHGLGVYGHYELTRTGYACDCPQPDAPTRPAVVLDPFVGTGTTVAVAHHLGRHGIGIDLSADYLRVAHWRCNDPKLRAKVLRVDPPKPEIDGQEALFGDAA